ncbi:uncharacterized protein LOC118355427 [Canis lupus dingo]|uniref:uncharacterized protein LOC118355427 n=1 Tax=Canis lupus dingo TaxID=286419 RepID=UPI0015F1BDE9|nr:uncharacterized protein LOC118355427 [Canis lupus dingo]
MTAFPRLKDCHEEPGSFASQVIQLLGRERREARTVKCVKKREQLGPERAFEHTHWPRPPSCPQSHIELKQQWEQLRFRRQESPWQRDSSCRQTPLQFTRSFSSLRQLPTQGEQKRSRVAFALDARSLAGGDRTGDRGGGNKAVRASRASQVGGQAHSKQLDFRHQLVPIAQPSCPTASLIIGLFDAPHRLTTSQPRVWGRCSPLAQVLFVAGAIGAGGAEMRPSRRGEAGAPRDATNPIRRRRSLRSPPSANTPLLLPQREEFPSSPGRPLASNFLGISHPVPFE